MARDQLRTAAQQALEAIRIFREWEMGQDYHSNRDTVLARAFAAEETLEAALAEPVQKSKYIQHGWLCPSCGAGNSPMNMRCGCKGWPKMEITC